MRQREKLGRGAGRAGCVAHIACIIRAAASALLRALHVCLPLLTGVSRGEALTLRRSERGAGPSAAVLLLLLVLCGCCPAPLSSPTPTHSDRTYQLLHTVCGAVERSRSLPHSHRVASRVPLFAVHAIRLDSAYSSAALLPAPCEQIT